MVGRRRAIPLGSPLIASNQPQLTGTSKTKVGTLSTKSSGKPLKASINAFMIRVRVALSSPTRVLANCSNGAIAAGFSLALLDRGAAWIT